MRAVVSLSPCGMGSAATTILPEAVADMPSAYSWSRDDRAGIIAALRGGEQNSGERSAQQRYAMLAFSLRP